MLDIDSQPRFEVVEGSTRLAMKKQLGRQGRLPEIYDFFQVRFIPHACNPDRLAEFLHGVYFREKYFEKYPKRGWQKRCDFWKRGEPISRETSARRVGFEHTNSYENWS